MTFGGYDIQRGANTHAFRQHTIPTADWICTSGTISDKVTEIAHLARYLSEHAPVRVEIRWGESSRNRATWRLDPDVLRDVVGRETVDQALTGYMETN